MKRRRLSIIKVKKICPRCGHSNSFKNLKNGSYKCCKCKMKYEVKQDGKENK